MLSPCLCNMKAQREYDMDTIEAMQIGIKDRNFAGQLDSILSNTIINYKTPINIVGNVWTLDSTEIDKIKNNKYRFYNLRFHEYSNNCLDFVVTLYSDWQYDSHYYVFNGKIIQMSQIPHNLFYKTKNIKNIKCNFLGELYNPKPVWELKYINKRIFVKSFYIDKNTE